MRTSAVVVDASLAVKWVVSEPDSARASAALDAWMASNTRLVAPAHFFVECTSVLYKRVTRRELTADHATDALDALLALDWVFDPALALTRVALALAVKYQLPSIYDAQYVALAEAYQVPLWTADRRLTNALHGRHPLVRSLDAFPDA